MKVVILAGGYGTRISEESQLKPKPMIEIGGKPILWHIMKIYSHYGYNEFIICAGYMQNVIKEWFANYYIYNSDITFDYSGGSNKLIIHNNNVEPWIVTVVDTGLDTMTGGRIKRVRKFIGEETFMLTYGDGLSDVDIDRLISTHKKNNKIVTLTSVPVMQNKGILEISENGEVSDFREKSLKDGARINGGFMVMEPEIFDYIEGDATVFEQDTLELLAQKGKLGVYNHDGFWQCMDTKREMDMLNELSDTGRAPWIKWK